MKKISLITLALLLYSFAMYASGIAVASSTGGKVSLVRKNKIAKLEVGSFLQSNDELKTLSESHLGFKSIDGSGSFRLFSNTSIGLISQTTDSVWVNKLTISQGSMFAKITPGFGLCTILTNTGIMTSDNALILVKVNVMGESSFTVLDGYVEFATPANPVSEIIGAGKTTLIDRYMVVSQRDIEFGDISAEESAFIYPPTKNEPQSLTIPMVDSSGKVKYVEINW